MDVAVLRKVEHEEFVGYQCAKVVLSLIDGRRAIAMTA